MGESRRCMLKAAVGLGIALPLMDLAAFDSAVHGQPDPRTLRPQEDDRLVLSARDRTPEVATPALVPLGGPPLTVYPMHPTARIVRDQSRLNQILLIHLDPGDLAEETRARGVAGIVAYSAVCTHTGCDVWEWQAETKAIKCACHFSIFDVKNGARVLDGPAPRRLPALPLKIVDGVLAAARGFVGRPGFQQGGA